MNERWRLHPDGTLTQFETFEDYMTFKRTMNEEQDYAYRKIGHTESEDGEIEVSTVFLEIDHAFGGDTPVLFETMVFGGPYNEEQERYCTLEEARAGHERWVKNIIPPPEPPPPGLSLGRGAREMDL